MSDVWGDICFDCLQVMLPSKIHDAAKKTVRLMICVLLLFGYLSQANCGVLVTIIYINLQIICEIPRDGIDNLSWAFVKLVCPQNMFSLVCASCKNRMRLN